MWYNMGMDAADFIKQTRVCVYMTQGFSYTTASGIEFSPEQPFQMMEAVEAQSLVADSPYRFRFAEKEEVVKFFSNQTEPVGPKRLTMV